MARDDIGAKAWLTTAILVILPLLAPGVFLGDYCLEETDDGDWSSMEADVLCSLNLFRSESSAVFKIELSKKKGPVSSSWVSSVGASCVAAGLAECSSMVMFGSRSF